MTSFSRMGKTREEEELADSRSLKDKTYCVPLGQDFAADATESTSELPQTMGTNSRPSAPELESKLQV